LNWSLWADISAVAALIISLSHASISVISKFIRIKIVDANISDPIVNDELGIIIAMKIVNKSSRILSLFSVSIAFDNNINWICSYEIKKDPYNNRNHEWIKPPFGYPSSFPITIPPHSAQQVYFAFSTNVSNNLSETLANAQQEPYDNLQHNIESGKDKVTKLVNVKLRFSTQNNDKVKEVNAKYVKPY
jgi:hypothetical protein